MVRFADLLQHCSHYRSIGDGRQCVAEIRRTGNGHHRRDGRAHRPLRTSEMFPGIDRDVHWHPCDRDTDDRSEVIHLVNPHAIPAHDSIWANILDHLLCLHRMGDLDISPNLSLGSTFQIWKGSRRSKPSKRECVEGC